MKQEQRHRKANSWMPRRQWPDSRLNRICTATPAKLVEDVAGELLVCLQYIRDAGRL